MHFLHFSQTPPIMRPSISLVLPLFLKRWINGNDEQESAIEPQCNSSVWCVRTVLWTHCPHCWSNAVAVASAAVKLHARTMGSLGSPDSRKQPQSQING